MAEISEKLSEKTFITNDNPRFEDEDSIINDIIAGFKSKNYSIIKNREEAIRKICNEYSNVMIVILGKGRDNYQIKGNNKIYHSDIGIIEEYFDELV